MMRSRGDGWPRRCLGGALLMAGLLTAACVAFPTAAPGATDRPPVTLTVYAAASLTEAFGEIGRQFAHAHPGVTVEFNFAGSQQLAQQLAQGAPADVFASANTAQMAALIPTGRVAPAAAKTFAHNRLMLIYPAESRLPLRSLRDLAQPGLKLVLAAKEVPAGQYALEFLSRASADATLGPAYREAVLANVVSYEANVKAVLGKVTLGEADAGIVYTTDLAGKGGQAVGRLDIQDALNPIAAYPIVVVQDSPHSALAQAFVDTVLGATGQEILAKYGFTAR